MSIVQVFVQTWNTLILGLNIILLINIDLIPLFQFKLQQLTNQVLFKG